MNDKTALVLPAQTIPVPESLSAEARGYLGHAAMRLRAADLLGVETMGPSDQTAEAEAALKFLRPRAENFKGSQEIIALPGGAKLYCMTPEGRDDQLCEAAFMDIHGGGFTSGGGEMCQILAKLRASDYGVRVYAVDYHLLPEHPYPSALDDCMAAYREVLRRSSAGKLVVGGASAGGNLAAAMLLRGRDENLPLPVALVLQTPGLDMTSSGDSYLTNRFLDVNLYGGAGDLAAQYAGNADRINPYISPLFGDFSRGWPPTILTTGTRDLLLSDTVRMHRILRRAGIQAELHVTEAGPHGGFMGTAPEDREIMAECRRFMYRGWGVDLSIPV